MFDLIIDIVLSKPGLFISGAVVGVIFDEWLTTKFSWATSKGRDALSELKSKLKGE